MQVAPCQPALSCDAEKQPWGSDANQSSSSAYDSPALPAASSSSRCTAMQQLPDVSQRAAPVTAECDLPSKGPKRAQVDIHHRALLKPLQREMLLKFMRAVDHSRESLVITNPLIDGNPIVYVTEKWQAMCGFSYSEAVGRNPRLTQGNNTDPQVVETISGALAKRSSCKVQLLNYRSGSPEKPFWNVLSICPLVYRGQLQLYIANLQDYSYHMSQMVSLTPSQFCRAAEHFQRGRHIPMDLPASSPSVH